MITGSANPAVEDGYQMAHGRGRIGYEVLGFGLSSKRGR